MRDFDAKLLRLKEALGVQKDHEVAEALGLSRATFSARKVKGNFPADEVVELAKQRPGLDLEYVLNGRLTLSYIEKIGGLSILRQQMEAVERAAERGVFPAITGEAAAQDMATPLADRNAGGRELKAGELDPRYAHLMHLLNQCTDDTLDLVVKVVEKMVAADAAPSKQTSKG